MKTRSDTYQKRWEWAARLWEWTPHPGQQRLLSLQLPDGSEPQTLIAACGRRWGKTEALAVDVALRVLLEPDLGQLIVAPTRDQANDLFESVAGLLTDIPDEEHNNLPLLRGLKVLRSPYPHIVQKATGATVLSARTAGRGGRHLRGKGTTRKLRRFRVVVDEAAFVPEEAIEQAIRPMLATVPGGGQLVLLSSPYGKRGPFYEAYKRGEAETGRTRALRCPSAENPLIDSEFLVEMREQMTERAFRAEFLAEFVEAAGAAFWEEDIQGCIQELPLSAAPETGSVYVAGVDFGRRTDYTVVVILRCPVAARFVAGSKVPAGAPKPEEPQARLTALARFKGLGWGAQVEKVAELLTFWQVRTAACDRTGVGDPICDEVATSLLERRVACAIEPVLFTPATKTALIDRLTLALSRREVTYPPLPELLTELRHFEWTETETGHVKSGGNGSHDDIVCALALALHAATPYIARARSGPPRFGVGLRAGKIP